MLRPQLALGAFTVGLAVGAGGAYLYVQHSTGRQVGLGRQPDRNTHLALEFGLPSSEAIRINEGYVAAFDYRTRNPKWVLEHLTEQTSFGDGDRKNMSFYEDKSIEEWLRSRLSDYRGSGYDRGHMAPAADHQGSTKAMEETFSLCNISPQVGQGFNRDYWARFEKFVRDLTRSCERVWVMTGPLWMPTLAEDGKWRMMHELIGNPPSLVSVPTHYYKVVVVKGLAARRPLSPAAGDNGGGRVEGGGAGQEGAAGLREDVGVAAFVMPNAPIDPATPLTAFVVPLEPLEAVAGVRFFPALLSKERMEGLDWRAQGVRAMALAGMKVLDRQALVDSVHPQLTSSPAATGVGPPLLESASSVTLGAAVPSASSPAGSVLAASPSGGIASCPGAPLARTVSAPVELLRPLPPAPKGCAHLCELLACRLPAERFWEQKGGGGGGREAGGGSLQGRGSRGPGRQQQLVRR